MSKVESKAELARRQRLPRDEYNSQMKDRTRAQILAAALSIAKRYGLVSVKRDAVASEANCAAGTVNFHFQTVAMLHNEVIKEAIRTRALRVIAEGIVGGYQSTRGVKEPLRSEALASYK